MNIYKLICNYIFRYKSKVLIYLIISLILSLLGIVAPYISGKFIDNLINNPTASIIYKFTSFYICIAILQLLLSYYVTILSTKIQAKVIFDFNKKIIDKIHKLSLLFLDTQNVVYLNQRVKADCSALVVFGLTSICGIIVNAISFIVCITVIINISLQISILILFLILAYYILYKLIKKPLEKVQYDLKESDAQYSAKQQEQYNEIRVMKIFNLFGYFSEHLTLAFNNLLNSSIRSARLSFLFKSSDTIITMFSQIILFIFGGIQIIQGNLTIGMFTVLSSYFANLVNNTKFFINLSNQYIDCKVSAKRIVELLNLEEEKNGTLRIDCINNIKLENLTFGYSSQNIINNLSLIFEKGSLYKIKGQNGKGKTTLINLLIGLYPRSYTGKILYNGLNLDILDLNSIRQHSICYIGQDPLIFNGTIRDNLLFDENSSSNKKIRGYIEKFHFDIYEKIGYEAFLDTEINQNLTNFSGGELKKLSIIRGLVNCSSVLIFDEPSNSLDMQSKKILQRYLKEKKEGHIIILVSHDDFYDSLVDKIIEF